MLMGSERDVKSLTHLKEKAKPQQYNYNPEFLERFENKFPDTDYWVSLRCFEFTSLCPVTGQPDFATLLINYMPDKFLVESKSLKLYLLSFRNEGTFNEDLTNTILLDLVKLLEPNYIEIFSEFNPRGGIKILPFVNYGKDSKWNSFAAQRLLHYDAKKAKAEAENLVEL